MGENPLIWGGGFILETKPRMCRAEIAVSYIASYAFGSLRLPVISSMMSA